MITIIILINFLSCKLIPIHSYMLYNHFHMSHSFQLLILVSRAFIFCDNRCQLDMSNWQFGPSTINLHNFTEHYFIFNINIYNTIKILCPALYILIYLKYMLILIYLTLYMDKRCREQLYTCQFCCLHKFCHIAQ